MLNSLLAGLGARRRILFLFLVCITLVLVVLTLLPPRSGARQSTTRGKSSRPRFVPGEVLVRYRNESTAQSKTGKVLMAARDGRQLAAQVERFDGSDLVTGLRLVRVAAEDTLTAVAALRSQPDVLYAEPNYILRASVVPNDPHFQAARQYALAKIGAQQVWDNFTTGSSGVVVGVIDQGIDIDHQDLQANIWTNPGEIPGNGVDDDANGVIDDVRGANFTPDPPNPPNGTVFSNTDPETHASHVAGIIGAVGNNTIGVTGINWTVRLMSLKFLDAEGFGDTADAISACNYAKLMRDRWLANNAQGANVRVLNASFGGGAFAQSFQDSVNALNSSGILFVSAAGNVDNGTREPNNDLVPHFPANFNAPNIISVAATNQDDNIPLFSHFGATTVDLGAPGQQILSTTPTCTSPGPLCAPDFTDPNQDTYTFFSGTSMAAPQVSGAAALLWAQNPNLTVAQVKGLLLYNGEVQTSLVNKSLSGRRLHVGNSFTSLQEADAVAPGAVTNLQITSQTGRTINLSWNAAGDDGAGGGSAALYEVNFVDGGTNAVIPLKGVVPLSPGSLQAAQVTIPYRHTSGTIRVREFDNKGNEGPPANIAASVPLLVGDPYTTSVGTAAALTTGGTPVSIDGDDLYVDQLLPQGFSFPFFGENFTELTISSNGNLYFSDPPLRQLPPGNPDVADDPPGSPRQLAGYKMIAGLWEDIDLRKSERADAGVFIVQPSASRLIFRWQGVPCNFDGNVCTGGAPINFEIELNTDGTIKTRYGSGNSTIFPTVGISGGDNDPYVIASHTSEESPINLTNAAEVTFAPRVAVSDSVQLSQATFSVGEAAGTVNINVTRSGNTSGAATVNFATVDNFGANCSQANGQAAANCDYNSAGATLQFAPGETSKTITVSIVNDGYVEGNETFTLTLTNPSGLGLGTPATTTITIADDDSSATNPFDGNAFFVRQQYLDFLFREPDAGGFNGWLGILNNCQPNQGGLGSDPTCDRVQVSSGFFRSTEFGERGYWSYRYYHASLGRRPLFAEFVPDMRRLGGFLTPDQQEAARAAFVADFMQKPEFQAIYAGLTNAANAAQFIAKLEEKAEVTLPATTTTLPGQPPQFGRQELINKMASGEFTAAQTLRAFIEQKVVFDRFFFRAFVAMQYFGYLLRDPEDAGYNDWVDVLTNGRPPIQPGDFRHLIFGFVWSVEYRQRFGP